MTAMPHCEDAAEYVSALADGETIPSAFAQHIGACTACQARLHHYLAMGAELRRVASLDADQPIPALSIKKRRSTRSVWKKGLETMRIPKFAFALLVLAVVVLASSLTVIKVGAHSSGSVLMLNVTGPNGEPHECIIDTAKKDYPCQFFNFTGRLSTGFEFRVLAKDGERVQLGIRSMARPIQISKADSNLPQEVESEPQAQYWFEVGQTLKLEVSGIGTVLITGEWTDHVPVIPEQGANHLDPGPDQVRILSPMLLKDNQVIGDMEGGMTSAERPSQVVWINYANVGRFLICSAPMKGGVQATARLNRVSFEIDGHNYVLLTGAPVSRSEKIWVLYQPDFKLPDAAGTFITSAELKQIAPEAVLPESQPRK